jgi:hypothetical protein
MRCRHVALEMGGGVGDGGGGGGGLASRHRRMRMLCCLRAGLKRTTGAVSSTRTSHPPWTHPALGGVQEAAKAYVLAKVQELGIDRADVDRIVSQAPAVFNRSESIFQMYNRYDIVHACCRSCVRHGCGCACALRRYTPLPTWGVHCVCCGFRVVPTVVPPPAALTWSSGRPGCPPFPSPRCDKRWRVCSPRRRMSCSACSAWAAPCWCPWCCRTCRGGCGGVVGPALSFRVLFFAPSRVCRVSHCPCCWFFLSGDFGGRNLARVWCGVV